MEFFSVESIYVVCLECLSKYLIGKGCLGNKYCTSYATM